MESNRFKTRIFLEKNSSVIAQFSKITKNNLNSYSDKHLKVLFSFLKLLLNGDCPIQKRIYQEIQHQYASIFKKMNKTFLENKDSFNSISLSHQELLRIFYPVIPLLCENISLYNYNLKRSIIKN